MKKITYLPIFLFVFLSVALTAAPTKESGTVWLTDFNQASALSKETHKPIVLFFTGSDWCGWCNKLEKEVFNSSEFVQNAGDKLIFVKLDFPMRTRLSPETTKQNEQLQEQYSVRSFPTLVLLDSDRQPIGVTGYRAGGGKQYAHHLIKMVNEYASYKGKMQKLGSNTLSGKDLKRLYQKAHELGLQNDVNILIKEGMLSDQAPFFLTERYRLLADAGQINSQEALTIKQKLLKNDPDNKFLTHYQLAIIDFETNSQEGARKEYSPQKSVAPLVAYIEKWGSKDKENLWRLNMVISQVYLDKNQYKQSLKYAQDSLSTAPRTIQPEIAMAIQNIQAQIEEN